MNSLLKVYKHMGGRYQRQMSKMGGALLQNEKPIIDQTPGRLQYYKAENEPFVPENVKWAIRMPDRYAQREEALNYLPEIKAIIEDYVFQHFSYDLLNGKELDVEEMTLGELKQIFLAQSETIKNMQQTGELQRLHEEFDAVDSACTVGQSKITDALDRAWRQIAETEDEIYESLQEADQRIRKHAAGEESGFLSVAHGDITLNNLQIADQLSADNHDHAVRAGQLRHLLGARVACLMVRADMLHSLGGDRDADFGDNSQRDLQVQYEEVCELRDTYLHAFGGDVQSVSGDAKIFKEQIDNLRQNELVPFLEASERRHVLTEQKEHAFHIDEHLTKDTREFV